MPFLCKALCVGDSGTRKTAAVASLVLAGFKLRIADLDDGLQILWSILEDHCHPLEEDEKGFKRIWLKTLDPSKDPPSVEAKTFRNTYGVVQYVDPNNKVRKRVQALSPATAFLEAAEQIDAWSDLDHTHILSLDSVSFFNRLAEENIRSLNGTLSRERISLPEIGVAREDIERILCGLFSPSTSCHVLLMAHIKYKEVKENQITPIPIALQQNNNRGGSDDRFTSSENPSLPYPNFIGNLCTDVGKYFNAVIGFRVSGVNAEMTTRPFNGLGVKSPSIKVKPYYAIPDQVTANSGLAAYFRDIGVQMPLAPTSKK